MNCLLVMKIKWSLDINTGAVERSEAARARRLAGVTGNSVARKFCRATAFPRKICRGDNFS